MNCRSPKPDAFEVRAAIFKYAPHDVLRTLAMWAIPCIFLVSNKWAWHWGVFAGLIVVGVFVVGGTTSSLPAIAIRSLPVSHSSDIWTPLRCIVFVAIYLVLWSLTYAAIK